MRGKLIVIEGSDCSGKQTQSCLLYEKLKKDGVSVSFFSFPMYDTPTGKIIKGPFLGSSNYQSYFDEGSSNVDAYVSSLYFAADRKYNIDKIINCLDNGTNVILDRYTTSNMGHQASKIFDKDKRLEFFSWVERLEYELLSLPKPDICVLLNVSIDYVLELEKNREELDGNEKNTLYLKNSIDTYLDLAKRNSYKVIECVSNGKLRSIDDINDELYQYINNEIRG